MIKQLKRERIKTLKEDLAETILDKDTISYFVSKIIDSTKSKRKQRGYGEISEQKHKKVIK